MASSVFAQDAKQTKDTEDWAYIQNADLRVGLLLSHGGAIAHLSSRTNDINTLNHYDHGEGIGVFVPGTSEATCYRFEGGSGSNCSYIAPLRTFALIPGLTYSYTAFFTLGDADTIRERFATLHRNEK
ncbi:hypothetical protein SH449x_002836 [Pirellulaceae bacterium SH449]